MSEDNLNSLINRSIYYWDYYLLRGEHDNLAAAWQFMQDYRKAGGTEYQETERAMAKHFEPLQEARATAEVEIEKPYRPKPADDCCGLSWEEIERLQGGKLKR